MTKTQFNTTRLLGLAFALALALALTLALATVVRADGPATYEDVPGTPVTIGSSTPCGGGEITRTFNVTETFAIGKVQFGFNADHTYRGDIRATLRSPAGTQVVIIQDSTTDQQDNYNVLLDDDSSNPLHSDQGDTTAPPYYARVAQPSNPLSAFNDETATGTWTLLICDIFGPMDDGTYNRSQLVLWPSTSEVALSKTVTPSLVAPGQRLTYTLAFSNAGLYTATQVVITDVVPISVTNLSYTSSGATIVPIGNVSYTWQVADLAQGEGGVITITGVLSTGLAGGLTFTNTATITTTSTESDAEDNLSEAGVTVRNVAPVASDASFSTLLDTPISGVLSASDVNGDTLTYGVATPPSHGNVTITDAANGNFVYTPTATYEGTDAFTYVVTDTGGLTDFATVSITVINPLIEIAKTPDMQLVFSGSTVPFTIAVTNTGNVLLTGVTVSDTLAPNCARTIGDLSPGEDARYTCTRTNVTAGFTNRATATGTPSIGAVVSDTDTALVELDPAQYCPADMIAYWKLDEAGGVTYEDYFDGHDGACGAQCPTPVAGNVNGGQAFDGNRTAINVPRDAAFDWGVISSFSIEFWFQTDGALPGNKVIIGRDDSASKLHWWVGYQASGEATFYLIDTAGTGAEAIGTTVLTDGAWHHVVASRDATADQIRLYVDGAVQDTVPVNYSSGFGSLTAELNVGWLDLLDGFYFQGILDEVALYDRALSDEEIRKHHTEGLVGRWYCQTGTYAPQIVSTPVTKADIGEPYSYDVEAAGNPEPTHALLLHPDGMTIDPATGLISWTPTTLQGGDHDVSVRASNSQGSDTQNFTVEVTEAIICPADMIAYWKLDETGSATYEDYFDGHSGACGAQCPTPVAGHVNGGQMFDGSRTAINVPRNAAFDWGVVSSFSIEFWFQTDSTLPGNKVIIGRDDNSTPLHWWVGYQDGGEAAFYLIDTAGTGAEAIGTTDLTDGAWHHVVALRDATADQIRLYVDGAVQGAAPAAYTSGFGSSKAELNIGWLDILDGFHFPGILDEVALYDGALSDEEIRKHHNEGLAGRWYCQTSSYAPQIVSTPVTEAQVGEPYSYDVEAAGNPEPTFTLLVPPDGMIIDPVTGLISWTPTPGQSGDHDVRVRASNSQGTDTQNFAVEVMTEHLYFLPIILRNF